MGILNKLVNYLSAKKNDNFLDGEFNKVEKSEMEWDEIEVDKLIKAEADKAGMPPAAIKVMKQMEYQYGDLMKQIRKKHNL